MAQLTEPAFSINGSPLMQFPSFSFYPGIFDHHCFTLICPADLLRKQGGSLHPETGPEEAFGAGHRCGVAVAQDMLKGFPGIYRRFFIEKG
ncbi:hypothetical protein A8C56_14560 [Niabella ginsenosidivorans]|uniref:Uncharacterized protein n=1 Tax=Niabella ginsenosidivorans TaxID=1176587 RepID=A0A1A9I4Q4_9BACT|nr:hypothetical protein [Niabella ginsenosidivorans]ANH82029.1 hypothetical protein A8C56_14560 [Niabella ginsenosidivorans]